MSDFPATFANNDRAREAPGSDALPTSDRRFIQGDFLAGFAFSTLFAVGCILLPLGAAQSQFIPPAHLSIQEVGPDEGYRKPGEPDNRYLSLINETGHSVNINYRIVAKDGDCKERRTERLAGGSRLDLPYDAAGHMDAEQATSVRYCAEYEDLPVQRLSGYGACGTLPASCALGGIVFSHVVPAKYAPGYLMLSVDGLEIEEGEQDSFTVSLSSRPTSTVTVSLVRLHRNRNINLDRDSLVFTPSDWNIAQPVTVMADEDADAVDDLDVISLIVQGDNYADDAIRVDVRDNDTVDGRAFELTGVTAPGSRNAKVALIEGGSEHDITVRLASRPTERVTMDVKVFGNGDIMAEPSQLIFTRSDWDRAQTITISVIEDADITDDLGEISLSSWGGNYSGFQTKIAVLIEDNDREAKPVDPSGPAAWPVQAEIFAIPPTGVRDQAVAHIKCLENDQGSCRVYLDCTDEIGSAYEGQTAPIDSGATLRLSSRDIVNIAGRTWEENGRLACAIRSELPVSTQMWTRSGDAVLVSNNEVIRSRVGSDHRHVAGIYSIPAPDSSRDISNIRIRCSPYDTTCTDTTIRCFDDDGGQYEATIGTIRRSMVRFMQTRELSDMIDHRWQGMGLSCELSSDGRFSVQVLTRTGGGALINNSASAGAPDYGVPLVTPGTQDTRAAN